MLLVKQVSYNRNQVQVLSKVDLAANSGTLLHVVGPNGCGKTTLIKLMSGLIEPEEGEVTWNDKSIASSDSGYKGDFAYLGHKYGLKPDLSARENLEIHAGLNGGKAMMTSIEALSHMGVAEIADVPCFSMSAGQKRRVSLARLLMSKVTLWLLDEPFDNLDDDACAILKDMIARQLEDGMVVVSSHREIDWNGIKVERFNAF